MKSRKAWAKEKASKTELARVVTLEGEDVMKVLSSMIENQLDNYYEIVRGDPDLDDYRRYVSINNLYEAMEFALSKSPNPVAEIHLSGDEFACLVDLSDDEGDSGFLADSYGADPVASMTTAIENATIVCPANGPQCRGLRGATGCVSCFNLISQLHWDDEEVER